MSEPVPPSPDAIAHYVRKWQAREPEMAIAEVFCPPSQRQRFLAWGALLHELREARFELSDARVTGVKLGWWAEEMFGLAQGRSRHPGTEALAGTAAPWSELGRALLDGWDEDVRAADTAGAIGALQPLARSVTAVEAALFDVGHDDEASRSLAIHWLLQRLPGGLVAGDQARLPMHLLARHGVTAAELAQGQGEALLRDWARELGAALPTPRGAALIRRSRAAFDRARLARLAAGRGFAAPPAPATLWRAWRAARSS